MAPPLHKAIANPQAFSDKIDKYIARCKAEHELATIIGLSLELDCDTGQLSKWASKYGKANEHDPHGLIAHAYKKVKKFSEWQLTQEAFSKNKAMALALGKCMYGWVEQQHVKHEHNGALSIVVQSSIPGALGKGDAKK